MAEDLMAESLENLSFQESEMESRSVKEQGSSRIQTECAMTAELLQNTLSIEKQVINGEAPDLSPLALAYVGDSIYDFRVRDYLCRRYQENLNRVNSRKTKLVCAKAQSDLMGYLIEERLLTEEELSVYRRARNHKSQSHSKNSSITDYRRATGFEAFLGYLYYAGKISRLISLVEKGLEHLLAEDEAKESVKL
jgi:possible ribonuclease III